jgi:hypothetical protein
MFDKPERMRKLLTGLNQKVSGQVQRLQRSSVVDDAPPAQRHDLTHCVTSAERGKPVVLPVPYTKGMGTAHRKVSRWDSR